MGTREQMRARTPADARWTLDPLELVQPEDPWYTDVEQHFRTRHYGVRREVVQRLTPSPAAPEYVQVGIIGHRGCGKTTMIRSSMVELARSGIVPVYVNPLAMLDQGDFSFSEVVLVLVHSVVQELERRALDIPKQAFQLVRDWFAESLVSEEHSKEILASVETTVKAEAGVPFLAKLMAKLTGTLKTDNVYRTEIRRRAERDPAELILRANQVLDAAHDALSMEAEEKRRLVVVFDNLEKIDDRRLVEAAVLRRADELRQLRCHLILFLSPFDQFAPGHIQASQVLDVVLVPMLPVRERTDDWGEVHGEALAALRALLEKRVDVAAVFQDPDACVREAAVYSGGRFRDFLAVMRRACEMVSSGRVSLGHVKQAVRYWRGNEIVPKARPGSWQRLAEIHRDKRPTNREEDAYLLLHSLVLYYDGDPWWDVHPMARTDLQFEAAWKELPKIEGR